MTRTRRVRWFIPKPVGCAVFVVSILQEEWISEGGVSMWTEVPSVREGEEE